MLASELVDAPPDSETLQTADAYIEQPLLLAITLADGEVSPLLRLPLQQNIHLSVAPDGRSLLLDLTNQAAATDSTQGPKIWHLPLVYQPPNSDSDSGSDRGLGAIDSVAANSADADGAETDSVSRDIADAADASDASAATPTVVDPETFPFSGIQATWLP